MGVSGKLDFFVANWLTGVICTDFERLVTSHH